MSTGETKTWWTPKRLARGPEAAKAELGRWGQEAISPYDATAPGGDDEPMDASERAAARAAFKSGKVKGRLWSAGNMAKRIKYKEANGIPVTPAEREAARATWRVNRKRELALKRLVHAKELGAPEVIKGDWFSGYSKKEMTTLVTGAVVAGIVGGLLWRRYRQRQQQMMGSIGGDAPPNRYLIGTLALAIR